MSDACFEPWEYGSKVKLMCLMLLKLGTILKFSWKGLWFSSCLWLVGTFPVCLSIINLIQFIISQFSLWMWIKKSIPFIVYTFTSWFHCKICAQGCLSYVSSVRFFMLVIWMLICSLVSYKVVLMFLLIQHSRLDLCGSRVEKAPWKKLFNLWLVHLFNWWFSMLYCIVLL